MGTIIFGRFLFVIIFVIVFRLFITVENERHDIRKFVILSSPFPIMYMLKLQEILKINKERFALKKVFLIF